MVENDKRSYKTSGPIVAVPRNGIIITLPNPQPNKTHVSGPPPPNPAPIRLPPLPAHLKRRERAGHNKIHAQLTTLVSETPPACRLPKIPQPQPPGVVAALDLAHFLGNPGRASYEDLHFG